MLSGSNGLFVFITVTDTLNAKLMEKSIIAFLRLKVPACISTVGNTHDWFITVSLFMRVNALIFPPHCSDQSSQIRDGVREGSRVSCWTRVSELTSLQQREHRVGSDLAWERTNLRRTRREGASTCVYLVGFYKALQIYKHLQISGKM